MIASTGCNLVHYYVEAFRSNTQRYSSLYVCCLTERTMNLQHMNGLAKALSVILIIVIIGSLILSAFPV